MAARGIRFGLTAALGLLSAFPGRAEPHVPDDIRQIEIKVWISETSEDGLRNLGVNFRRNRFVRHQLDAESNPQPIEQSNSVQSIRTDVFEPNDSRFTVTLPPPDRTHFTDYQTLRQRGQTDRSVKPGFQQQSGLGVEFDVLDVGRGTIEGVFRGIEQGSDFDLISKPEILVLNNRKASIHAGGEVPFQDVKHDPKKGTATLNVGYKKVGVNLVMRPKIVEQQINLDIETLEVTDYAISRNIRGVDLPVFSTRSQTGVVVVPNGETLVIGGLSTRRLRRSEQRVPLVGRVPILGIFFRGRDTEAQNSHLLIFVSATIVDLTKLAPAAERALQFWREERWRNRERIDREIETLEQEL